MKRPAWSVQCPRCGAPVGASCTYPNGGLRAAHQERVTYYLRTPAGDPFKDDSRKADDSTSGTVNTG